MYDHIRIYSSNECLAHDTGTSHPERAARLNVLLELINTARYNAIKQAKPSLVKDSEITRVHSKNLLHILEESAPCEEDELEFIDGDTLLSAGSLNAAKLAAGAVVDAVNDIKEGATKIGLCINRPPGHHATHNQSMGFCLFNNVMVGAAHAASIGFERIAIVDFDVHHGNGCTDILSHIDLPCFYISSHQAQHYPGTGRTEENIPNKILNIPLPAGTNGSDIRKCYEEEVFPAIHAYKPDLLFISAGFDAHKNDPYGGFNLIESDYAWLTKELYQIAKDHTKSRLISVLEGGYDLDALSESYAAHLDVLMNN